MHTSSPFFCSLPTLISGGHIPSATSYLKVPKCEIFDRSDFDDFYTVKSLCEGDFGVKIKKFYKNIWGFI
jgi:hypothetical protein